MAPGLPCKTLAWQSPCKTLAWQSGTDADAAGAAAAAATAAASAACINDEVLGGRYAPP